MDVIRYDVMPTNNQCCHFLLGIAKRRKANLSLDIPSHSRSLSPEDLLQKRYHLSQRKDRDNILRDRFKHVVPNIVTEKVASFWSYGRFSQMSKHWVTHVFLILFLLIYTLVGGVLFTLIEGHPESIRLQDIQETRSALLTQLKEVHESSRFGLTMTEAETFEARTMQLLRSYESNLIEHFNYNTKILSAESAGLSWEFWNAVFFCGTIYTTIGYGHIVPVTTAGRSLTMIYAFFGVPLFLTLLADFGKMFTRAIKFLWVYVRRVYYTGNCTREHPLEMGKDLADDEMDLGHGHVNIDDEEPNPEHLKIDDEFNLPISVALTVLTVYVFIGATAFYLWEKWTFFEAFYFVFISMTTIGLGDFVPVNHTYMMISIVYIVFGLALTSMCINVAQEKMADTFTQASTKLGATIGIHLEDTPHPSIGAFDIKKASMLEEREDGFDPAAFSRQPGKRLPPKNLLQRQGPPGPNQRFIEPNPTSSKQRQAPVSPMQRQAPVSPMQRQAPVNPMQRQAPVSPMQRQAPVNPMQRQVPISPVERQRRPPGTIQRQIQPNTAQRPFTEGRIPYGPTQRQKRGERHGI